MNEPANNNNNNTIQRQEYPSGSLRVRCAILKNIFSTLSENDRRSIPIFSTSHVSRVSEIRWEARRRSSFGEVVHWPETGANVKR
jgi:hypothetical protein